MEIKSITTKYVAEQPFAGLVITEGEFVPYYETVIRYTDTRAGERDNRVYSVYGKGGTEFSAEADALDALKAQMSAKVFAAYEDFMVANGAGNLEIA